MKETEIQLPTGSVPEGKKPGDEFDAVTTYRIKDNGMCCIVMVGDVKMEGYDKADASKSPPDYSQYAKSMQDARMTG